jgi:hypothetical protein
MRRPLPALLLAVALAWRAFADERPQAPGYRVIVNAKNPVTALERRFVADALLKKATRWPDGTLIRPADLGPDAPARERFSQDVLDRSVAAVKSYWEQSIFSGRETPPPELDSDAAVIDFVVKHPGAIGYVSGASDVTRVKVVTVR